MPRLRRLTALSLAALAFAAAACGSDEVETPGAPESAEEAPLQDEGVRDPAEGGTPAPEESPRGTGEGD